MGFCIYEIRRLYVEGIEILKPEGQKEFIDEVAMRFGQIGSGAGWNDGRKFEVQGCQSAP